MTQRRVIGKDSTNYVCVAPKEVFVAEYADVPEEYKKIIEEQGGLRCDGGGIPSRRCAFGECKWFGGYVREEFLTDEDDIYEI